MVDTTTKSMISGTYPFMIVTKYARSECVSMLLKIQGEGDMKRLDEKMHK